MWIPVHRTWRLNERHYGALQGLNKAETAAKFGEEQVQDLAPQLRRSAARPHARRRALPRPRPALREPRRKEELPLTECLKDTVARFLPLLARDHRARHQGRQAGADRRPRQQPARAGEVPRQRLREATSSSSTSPPACRWSTSSTTT